MREARLTLFKKRTHNEPKCKLTISEFLTAIKEGKWKLDVNRIRGANNPTTLHAWKNSLPCVTVSGDFKTRDKTVRVKDKLVAHSGLICIDIDKKDNPGLKVKDIIDRECVAQFVSCSGQGIKIIYACSKTKDKDTHKRIFDAAVKRLGELSYTVKVDGGVSFINAVQYVSYDPQIYINDNPTLVLKPEKKKPRKRYSKSTPSEELSKVNDLINELGSIDITRDRSEWIKIAMVLADTFGEDGRELFHKLSENYPGYTWEESNSKFDEFLTNQDIPDNVATLGTLFYIASKYMPSSPPGKVKLTSRKIEIGNLEFDKKAKDSEMCVRIVSEVLSHYSIMVTPRGYMQYTGTHWEEVERFKMGQFLVARAIECGVDPVRAGFHKFADNLIKQLDITAFNNPDTIPGMLNFANGTLNTATLELQDHDASDFLYYCLPYEYNPNAKCDKFMAYLSTVLPEAEDIKTIQSYLGCCFLDLKVEQMLCLLGDGGNGKSVLLDTIAGVLGENNVSHVNIDSIASTNPNADNYRLSLENKILNVSSESKFKGIDMSVWKQLASKEPVMVHAFHRNRYMIKNYARTIYAMNQLPPNHDDINNGYFRRLNIVQFEVTIEEKDRNYNLSKEIVERESPGVLNWIVDSIRLAKTLGGIHQSEKSKGFIKELEVESDSVQLFIEDEVIEPANVTPTSPKFNDFYIQYCAFCSRDLRTNPVGRNKFASRLRRSGFTIDKNGTGGNSTRRVGTVKIKNITEKVSSEEVEKVSPNNNVQTSIFERGGKKVSFAKGQFKRSV